MDPTPPSAPTLRHEWMLIGIAVLLAAACPIVEAFDSPAEQTRGTLTLWGILGMLIAGVAQVGWISMDRRRRGREVGQWRFAVLLVGPLAIAVYLALEYRLRALYLIPLMIAVYATGILLPVGILLALEHFR
jgi:hypothetical protein